MATAKTKSAKETPPVAAHPAEALAQKRIELIETKRSHAAGELVNPRALSRIRKDIARLLTQQNMAKHEQPKKGATV